MAFVTNESEVRDERSKTQYPSSDAMYRRLSAHLLMTNTVSLLLLLWIVFLYRQSLEQPYRYERPKVELRGLAEIPVEREMRQFHTGIQPGDTTPFMGGLTDEANAAWASILDGQHSHLHDEQHDELTAPSRSRQAHARASRQAPLRDGAGSSRFFQLCRCPRRLSSAPLLGTRHVSSVS